MSVIDINLTGVQETLVSGTNIKTINGEDILGSGDLEIPFMNADNDSIIHLILTGQSNAAGRGDNTDANTEELAVQESVEIWNPITSTYEQLNISAGNNNNDVANKHGIELGLAQNFRDYFPNKTLRLIKHAVGGSSIDTHLINGAVFKELFNDNVVPAINQTLSEGKKCEVYIVFAQGENDSNTLETSLVYANKFNDWASLWKSKLGVKLSFRIIQIIESDSNDVTINTSFRNQSKLEPVMDYLLTKDLSTDDNLHYNYAALKDVSELFLKSIKYNRSNLIIKENLSLSINPTGLLFSDDTNDYISFASNIVYTGVFYVEFKVIITSQSNSGFVSLCSGQTGSNSDRCRILINVETDRVFIGINEVGVDNFDTPFSYNTEYTFRISRGASNVVSLNVNNGPSRSFGVMAGNFIINKLFRSDDYLFVRGFNGSSSEVDLNGSVFTFNEGSGTTVLSSGSETGTIETDSDINYINDTMWL